MADLKRDKDYFEYKIKKPGGVVSWMLGLLGLALLISIPVVAIYIVYKWG